METLISVVAVVSLGLFALRFGADFRPAIRSNEHRFALAGMLWGADSCPPAPVIGSLGREPGLVVGASSPFPTLRALDRARDPGQPPFADDPDAARLERRARDLTDQHWSERAWLTGRIDQARFDLVCDALERERQSQQRTGPHIDVIVVSDHPSSIAS